MSAGDARAPETRVYFQPDAPCLLSSVSRVVNTSHGELTHCVHCWTTNALILLPHMFFGHCCWQLYKSPEIFNCYRISNIFLSLFNTRTLEYNINGAGHNKIMMNFRGENIFMIVCIFVSPWSNSHNAYTYTIVDHDVYVINGISFRKVSSSIIQYLSVRSDKNITVWIVTFLFHINMCRYMCVTG